MSGYMARALVGAVSFVIAFASATGFARTDFPTFEFKGVKAGEVVDTSVAGQCKMYDRTLSCIHPDDAVASAPVGDISFRFYENRLISMEFVFQNSGFSLIKTGFQTKYGQPCSTKNLKWQNQMGAVLDNPIFVWCFKTGKLHLQARGERSNVGSVFYEDDFQPPSQAVPIDF